MQEHSCRFVKVLNFIGLEFSVRRQDFYQGSAKRVQELSCRFVKVLNFIGLEFSVRRQDFYQGLAKRVQELSCRFVKVLNFIGLEFSVRRQDFYQGSAKRVQEHSCPVRWRGRIVPKFLLSCVQVFFHNFRRFVCKTPDRRLSALS